MHPLAVQNVAGGLFISIMLEKKKKKRSLISHYHSLHSCTPFVSSQNGAIVLHLCSISNRIFQFTPCITFFLIFIFLLPQNNLSAMLRQKQFVKKTKSGKVLKVVKEHYLRDDIWCSIDSCKACGHTETVLSASPSTNKLFPLSHYIIPDTNIFMNQVSILNTESLVI